MDKMPLLSSPEAVAMADPEAPCARAQSGGLHLYAWVPMDAAVIPDPRERAIALRRHHLVPMLLILTAIMLFVAHALQDKMHVIDLVAVELIIGAIGWVACIHMPLPSVPGFGAKVVAA